MSQEPQDQKQSEMPAHHSPPYYGPPPYYIMMQPPPKENAEVSLVDLWRALVQDKWLIIAVSILFTLGAVIFAIYQTPIYRAETLLMPVKKAESGGLRTIAGQYAGLAELAGISLPISGDLETAIATLKSRRFITGFIEDRNLKPILFDNRWDTEQKKWLLDSPSFISRIKNAILPTKKNYTSKKESLAPGEPSIWEAYSRFNKAITVDNSAKSGLVTVMVDWKDPELAARWANALVQRLNNELRQQAIQESERGIRYLNEQIEQTSLADLRTVLYRVVEEHTKNMTLAKVNEQYALKVIDPAIPPENYFKPNRKLLIVLGFILGLMTGIFVVFLRNLIR